MKILVIGGMHGNEPLGIRVVKMFQAKPTRSITSILANEEAVAANRRFIQQDLNRSFPGDIRNKEYEKRRAAQMLTICRNYDITLDFHNTHCPDNDCSFVGESGDKKLLNISGYFGLKKVIVADYDCINKYARNCISIEISLSSNKMDPKIWYEKICELSMLDSIPANEDVEKYRFVYRMTLEDRDRLSLSKKKLKAFKPISRRLAFDLNVKSPAFPIFIDDKYTPYNYGGLLNKL